MAGATVPQILSTLSHSRTIAAARYLAARMQSARGQAAATGTYTGVRVAVQGREVRVATFRDGNHNGVRTADITGGLDPEVEREVALGDLFPDVQAGAADGTAPPPVADLSTTLFSFAPAGTASSGTVYLRGRDEGQYAVRVLGATGRVRVLRFRASTGDWVDVR